MIKNLYRIENILFYCIFACGNLFNVIKTMRSNKGRDANMKFLFGSVFFFFVIMVTIVLFAYFSLQEYWNKPGNNQRGYQIAFSQQFTGLSYDIYMNDSLVYIGAPVNADTILSVPRLATDNSLLVVEHETQLLASILQVEKKEGRLLLYIDGGDIKLK